MNFIFSKKALWAVVFAAAAIFAVTFVACSSDSDDPPAPSYTELEVEAGDAVQWVAIADGGGTTQWVIAEDGKALDPTAKGYYKKPSKTASPATIIAKASLGTVTTADVIAFTGASSGVVYSVVKVSGSGTYSNAYFVGSGSGTIAATGAKVGDVLVVRAAGADVVVVAASTVSGTGDNAFWTNTTAISSTSTVYHIEKLQGAATSGYYVSDSSTSGKIVIPNVTVGDILKVTAEGVAVATSTVSGTGDTAFWTNTTAISNTSTVYHIEKLQGAATSGYYVSDNSTSGKIVILNVTVGDILKVTALTENTDYIVSVANKVEAKYAGAAAGDLVKVTEIVSTGTSNNGLKELDAEKKVTGVTDKMYIVAKVSAKADFIKF